MIALAVSAIFNMHTNTASHGGDIRSCIDLLYAGVALPVKKLRKSTGVIGNRGTRGVIGNRGTRAKH